MPLWRSLRWKTVLTYPELQVRPDNADLCDPSFDRDGLPVKRVAGSPSVRPRSDNVEGDQSPAQRCRP
jgi:hypothetical protein